MSQFFGLVGHEFKMSIRRPGLWIAYGLLFIFYSFLLFSSAPGSDSGPEDIITKANLWNYAAEFIFQFNLFLPVVAGILASDRMQRDFRLNVRELQVSAPLGRTAYVVGKYLGVLSSLLLPVFLWILVVSSVWVLVGQAPAEMLYAMPVVFLAITLPAFAFVTAFSLLCPLFLPLRVYQILFTGYWFWGNFLNPEAFPSISDTYLEASGMHAFQGFFGGFPGFTGSLEYTSLDAAINLSVLAACIVIALFAIDRYLNWRARRA